MIYKIRAILDSDQDVIRTLLIDGNSSLESLHHALVDSFAFNPGQMASFYHSDEDWNQGDEIPLFSMGEGDSSNEMASFKILDKLISEKSKLLYVYDFLAMWTCYIELVSIEIESEHGLPFLLVSIGDTPAEAPEKSFEATGDKKIDPFSDEALFGNSFEDDFSSGGFENIDDLDPENF